MRAAKINNIVKVILALCSPQNMNLRKGLRTNSETSVKNICPKHSFTSAEKKKIQLKLLQWYDKNQRHLPWRTVAKTEKDPAVRGYAVWVSEVMLQQTQVATVIPYYVKWMEKWPTVNDLAESSLEEVNEAWAGLGYYSRARRLYEGANIILKREGSCMPLTMDSLKKDIPGIGRYTASAIASVAFQEAVGVVDGNVVRVLSRLRVIGSDITKPQTIQHFWLLADDIVSKTRPGDFNQALMELGATVCHLKTPNCNTCPLNTLCEAYEVLKNEEHKNMKLAKKQSKKSETCVDDKEFNIIPDIESLPGCTLCLSKDVANSNVTAYPFKPKKKSVREQTVAVIVVEQNSQLLILQRPETGLLAGLWEFPSVLLKDNCDSTDLIQELLRNLGISTRIAGTRKEMGDVVHLFSHIRSTYIVEHLVIKNKCDTSKFSRPLRWVSRADFMAAAVSTAMKKVLSIIDKSISQDNNGPGPRKKKQKIQQNILDTSKQTSIKKFFNCDTSKSKK